VKADRLPLPARTGRLWPLRRPRPASRRSKQLAAHNKRQEDLRADAARLAADPEYQADIRAVREDLDELRAW
jgi:hypothetical protein